MTYTIEQLKRWLDDGCPPVKWATIARALVSELESRDKEIERLKAKIDFAPHAPKCHWRTYPICAHCGHTGAGHMEGRCLNGPYREWEEDPPRPCDCWKADVEVKA